MEQSTSVTNRPPEHFRYGAYGVAVTSDMPLALPPLHEATVAAVECRTASASAFGPGREHAQSLDNFHRCALLPDGSTYLGWDTVGEFVVSADGRSIQCRRANSATWESFQVYMLGQAISFALVAQRIEPLHATTVVVEGEAIAFVGDSAHGKSSLAACFLDAGHRLLTDDLLVLEDRATHLAAYPGPARIKLFPSVATRFLPNAQPRARMNSGTDKMIVALEPHQRCAATVPLKAIYAVTAPREACRRHDVDIQPLSGRAAFLRLLAAAFNRRIVRRFRLSQQFETMAMVSTRVPIHTLSYPRSLDRLGEVRDAVLAHRAGASAAA